MLYMFWREYRKDRIKKEYFYKGIDYLYSIYECINVEQEDAIKFLDETYIEKIEYVCNYIIGEGIRECLSESNVTEATRIVEKIISRNT